MDFDSFLDQAWTDHADQPAAVAERVTAQGLALLRDERQVAALAQLAQHVHGQHLGRWAEGLAFQQTLAALPCVTAGGPAAQALQRHQTVLQLASGETPLAPDLPPSDATRLQALTAAALGLHAPQRAAALLHAAVAGATALPDADPGVRALAASANNLASALQDENTLAPTQQRLMVDAALAARATWARAGTWLEVERADYRLALCQARAGDFAQARANAQACLARVQAQPEPGAPALEHFFGWEALARVEAAAGDGAAHTAAAQQAQTWFMRLAEADQGWCRPSLEALHTPRD